ncbi:hypothetical protein [robinz microvirus RP_45]|nr:hypothetical protein [robinz microvirus RP_45]
MAQEPRSSTDVYKTTDKNNRFSDDNKEILNPTPMQPPLGYKAAPSLVEQIRQQVRQFKHLDDNEPETEEDADDFEIDDDPQPESRWENDMIPSIKETRARLRALVAEEKLYAKAPTPTEGAKTEVVKDPPVSS